MVATSASTEAPGRARVIAPRMNGAKGVFTKTLPVCGQKRPTPARTWTRAHASPVVEATTGAGNRQPILWKTRWACAKSRDYGAGLGRRDTWRFPGREGRGYTPRSEALCSGVF